MHAVRRYGRVGTNQETRYRCFPPDGTGTPINPIPADCLYRIIPATEGSSYSETFSRLLPDTGYVIYLDVFRAPAGLQRTPRWETGKRIVVWTAEGSTTPTEPETPGTDTQTETEPETPSEPETPTEPETPPEPETPSPPEPETPTEPETPRTPPTPPEPETPSPPEPETPEPEAPTEPETPEPGSATCTYEHRLIAVPGTTANAYTGRILVSSKTPGATATIRAFHRDNGHPIDVLDSEGDALTGPVSLDPARSVKRFSIEAIQGWHPVTVEHPSESAMQAATVAMRVREPGGSIEDSYPPEREHCQPATGTTTPAPDLAVRDAQALLWPNTLDWRATVENIGDATAPETSSVRLYHGDRRLATQAVRRELAPGATWPMSHAINRAGATTVPDAGAQVRICVDPVPGEPESKRANNCASVTVERN